MSDAGLSRFRRATAAGRVLPDFIVIGAQKAGTSSLYRYLTAHPTVAPAARKEVHYFDWGYARGPGWYRAHFPMHLTRRLFRARTGQYLTAGEASPYYLFHPHVPRRVRALLPRVKLIALLRDPVERALSSYHHQVRRGRETLALEEAFDREPERLAPEIARLEQDDTYLSPIHRNFSYLARGLYAEQLARWQECFPREQLLVIRSEDFFTDTARVFAEVLAFLDLAPWQPATFKQFNAADYPDMAPELRQRLTAYYAPHNERLYALLGRDLQWARPLASEST